MEIPGYRIEHKLAEGGMAAVYQAVQMSLERPVALKILKDTDEPTFSQRFLEEGKTIAALRHPNIITIYDIGIADGIHYISMELVEGGDLDDRIGAGLKPDKAVKILRKLAGCLNYVHSKGVVHRDIKPGNILFRDDGEPLLTDFGIAKQLGAKNKLTLDSVVLGSPFYLSPEQSQSKKVDGRSDIYSLGIVFYEMLTGRRPFEGKAPIDTILMHLQEPLPKLKKSLRRFQPLLDKMAAKEPKKRFKNCAALLKAIDKLDEKRDGPAAEVEDEEDDFSRFKPVGAYGQGQTQTMDHTPTGAAQTESTGSGLFSRLRLWAIFIVIVVVFFWSGMPTWLLNKAGILSLEDNTDSSLIFDWGKSIFSKDDTSPAGNQKGTQNEHGKTAENSNLGLADYLRLARTRLTNDRLTLPSDDNAWFYYKMALEIDPRNSEAHRGLRAITDRYIEMANESMLNNDTQQAKTYLKRGLQVTPNHKRTQAMLTRITEKEKGRNLEQEATDAWQWVKGWFN